MDEMSDTFIIGLVLVCALGTLVLVRKIAGWIFGERD